MASSKQQDDETKTGSQRGGSGNLANDPQRASEAGKKGGEQSHQGSTGSNKESGTSQRGGSGNFADDPEKAREAGRKGGQQSGGGSTK